MYQLEWRSRTQFVMFLVCIFILGLIVGALYIPAPAPSVGNDRIVEKPVLFDPPLKKGVENLNWEY